MLSEIILCVIPVRFCTIMEMREVLTTTVLGIFISILTVLLLTLDTADGLKKLLTKYGFTLKQPLNMPSSELAEFLGIDKYVAQIIGSAATKLSNIDNIDKASDELQTKNCVTF
jgi:hypothetical protein